MRERADAILTRAGIAASADRATESLAFGEERLLELARALAVAPTVLLLDEPLSGLNPDEIGAVIASIRARAPDGVAVVLVEHAVGELLAIADRVVVLDHGRKIAEGAPQVRRRRSAGDRRLHRGRTGMTADNVPVLDVEGISTIRGRVQVLWDVSLSVGRGQTVAIVGPNGAGKTTLVGSITGLVPPKSGRHPHQRRRRDRNVARAARSRRVALVPERRGIFAPLTVRENLLMGAYARRAKRADLVADLDDVFGLFPALVRLRRCALAGSLSGGEQQMVAIGRALMAKPELLLLDEPSLGLAPKVRAENFGALARLAERGVTILLVEQNLRLAARICGRAYLMQRGRIVGTETSEELARSARHVYLESHGEAGHG